MGMGLHRVADVTTKRPPNKRRAICHPDRDHVAKGFCMRCYTRARYYDPITGPQIRARVRAYQLEFGKALAGGPAT